MTYLKKSVELSESRKLLKNSLNIAMHNARKNNFCYMKNLNFKVLTKNSQKKKNSTNTKAKL